MSISDTQNQIKQAQDNISNYKSALPDSSSQDLLRATGFSSPLQAQLTRGKIESAKANVSQAESNLEDYKTQFNQYLNSDQGKIDYAKENNLTPVTYEETSFSPSPGNFVKVQLPVYNTPYGKVIDQTPLIDAQRNEARIEGQNPLVTQAQQSFNQVTGKPFSNVNEFVNAVNYGVDSSGKVFSPSTITSTLSQDTQSMNLPATSVAQKINFDNKFASADNSRSNLMKGLATIGTVSAAETFTSSNINLNNTNKLLNNVGTNSLLAGVDNRVSSSNNNIQQPRNIWGSIADIFNRGNTQGYEKGKEIYDPTTGGFVQALNTQDISKTYKFNQAAYEANQAANARSDVLFAGIGNQPAIISKAIKEPIAYLQGINNPDVNSNSISIGGKPLWAVQSGVDTTKTKIINGVVVPSNELLTVTGTRDGKQVNEYTIIPEGNKFTDLYTALTVSPSVYMNAGLDKLNLPTDERQALYDKMYSQSLPGIGNQIKDVINPIVPTMNMNTGVYDLERNGNFFQNFGTGLTDFFFADTPAKLAGNELVLGASMAGASLLGPTLGTGLGLGFTGYSGYKYATASSPEEKESAAFNVGLGLLPFAKVGFDKVWGNDLFSNPVMAEKSFRDVTGNNPIKTERNILKIVANQDDNVLRINIKPTPKGSNNDIEVLPTGSKKGVITEFRDAQPIRNKIKGFLNDYGFNFKPKLDVFSGDIKINPEGASTETMDYGKYNKVTETNNLGEGTSKLYKGDKLIETRKVIPEPNDNSLNVVKTKNIKINQEFNSNPKRTQTNIDLKAGKIKMKNLKIVSDQAGNSESNIRGNIEEPNLNSAKGKLEVNVNIVKTSNLEKGLVTFDVNEAGYSDIVKSGPRVGKVELASGDNNLKVSKRISQEIVEGQDNEIDKSLRIKKGKDLFLKKSISPTPDRTTTNFAQSSTDEIYVNPKSKLLDANKITDELTNAKWKEIKSNINQNKRIANLKEQVGNVKKVASKTIKFLDSNVFPEANEKVIVNELDGIPRMVGGNRDVVITNQEKVNDALNLLNDMSDKLYVEPVKLNIEPVSIQPKVNSLTVSNPIEFTPVVNMNTNAQVRILDIPKQTISIKENSLSATSPISNLALSNVSMLKLNPVSSIKFNELSIDKINEKSDTKLNQQQENNQQLTQEFKQELRQQFNQPVNQIDRTPRNEPRPEAPKTIKEISFPSMSTTSKSKRLFKRVNPKKTVGSFDVYTRVKGKEVLIAPRVTKQAGLDIGAITTLRGSRKASALSASIILKSDPLAPRQVQTSGEFGRASNIFRVGKVSGKNAALTLVQKQGVRLGTTQERIAIVQSRKRGILSLA